MLLVWGVTSWAWAQDAAQRRQELSKLKTQAQQKEQELKKYREQEKKISKEMTDLQQKKVQADKLKNKVEKDLSFVEQNLVSIEDKQAALARSMPLWQNLVWQETARYYIPPHCPVCPTDQPLETALFLNRTLAHQAAFAGAMQEEKQAAATRLADFTEQNKKLQAQNTKLKHEQAVLSQSFQQKKQDLDVTKRKADAIRKELAELSKSAQELNALMASFERKRVSASKKNQQTTQTQGPKLAIPPHSLPWPVQGNVLSKFGKEYRADLNTYIFREGIKISSAYGNPVHASAAGSVIYAGPFRSYGNVVILDHGKGFFSIYGFLQEISVALGDKLEVLEVLGKVGKDTQASSGTGKSAVYFEIRQGTQAVDPLQWLK